MDGISGDRVETKDGRIRTWAAPVVLCYRCCPAGELSGQRRGAPRARVGGWATLIDCDKRREMNNRQGAVLSPDVERVSNKDGEEEARDDDRPLGGVATLVGG